MPVLTYVRGGMGRVWTGLWRGAGMEWERVMGLKDGKEGKDGRDGDTWQMVREYLTGIRGDGDKLVVY